MNKFLKIGSVVIASIFYILIENCSAKESIYIGINNQICKTCFNKDHGDTIFNKVSSGFNPFFGVNFKENFALELGYQHIKANRTVTLHFNDIGLGFPLPQAMEPATFSSKFTIKGPHFDAFAYTPRYDGFPLRFFSGIGISRTTVIFKRKCMQFGIYSRGLTRTFEKTRTLRRITLGAELDLNDNLSFRVSSIFINTKKLTSHTSDGLANIASNKVVPKNTVCYSIGFKYTFK